MDTAVKPDRAQIWMRILVLLSVISVLGLLTRCRVRDLYDTPVLPPSSLGGR